MKIPEITRMLVLTGIVTIATENGSLQAAENEAIVAKANEAPEKIIVQANSKFATKLYTQLAKSNPGQNIFFSPYSVSSALLMTAEGARGATAEEMGQVLGFPKNLRRVGKDAQSMPWEMAKIHTAISTLNKLFKSQNETPERDEIKKKITALERQLKETTVLPQITGSPLNSLDIGKELSIEIERLRSILGTIELKIANTLWVNKSFPIKKSYLTTINEAYGTKGIMKANFRTDPEAERLRINNWVENQTQKRIKNLLQQGSIGKMTELVITNAIYFKGDWKAPFNSSDTNVKDFQLQNGTTAKVPLMHAEKMSGARYAAFNADGSFFNTPYSLFGGKKMEPYPNEDGFSLLELPYQGNNLSMVIIAPNKADGLRNIETQLTEKNIFTWINKSKFRDVDVTLPKFQSKTSYSLAQSLKAMGMATAFEPRANFRGIADISREVYISKVIHKAFVDVNESGTEAAASTASERVAFSASLDFIPKFNADRPFIYFIRDTKTGSILFLGRMMNPKG